ncbi:MAG: sigma-70 family RNA polymerase sigma factor [Bacteroidales bacterium]|jgi:RNA polymerase sigma factor (sigma-70 family)|nr:sigma-70 family RNA polymerase sigma factor [Bacteroidales bacterium]
MDISKLKDQELVNRFVKGEKYCMQELINRHKDRVYTYILLIVKNPDVADDLFQDTFIKVIQSLKKRKYKDEGRFVSWVMRIAHNLTIDYFRKNKNQNTYSNDQGEFDMFNNAKFSDSTIEDNMISDQTTRDVRFLIDKLPKDQKQVVLMRHYGNMSFKEIAEQTGVSINTALGRMRYALINMRKFAEEHNMQLANY